MYNTLESRYKVKTISEGEKLIGKLKTDRLFEDITAGVCTATGAGFASIMAYESALGQDGLGFYIGLSAGTMLSIVGLVNSIKKSRSISEDIGAIQTELNSVEKGVKTR